MLDLLQVDLLASGASLVWPRATKSGEVDLSRLMGFPFAFRAKNGGWRDLHLGFQVSFASPCLQWRNVQIPLQLNLLNMCVYLHHRRCKFVYFVRKLSLTMILGESWQPQGAGKKQKLVSIPSQYWERRFQNQGILDIHTHFKPTETFQYTHFSSCNPHMVRKGVIKGEALIPVRTNSSSKSFYENIYNFKKRLCARGYCHNLIEKITSDRRRLLPLRLNLPSRSQLYKRTLWSAKENSAFHYHAPPAANCRTLKTF